MFVVMWIDGFNTEKFSTFRTAIRNEEGWAGKWVEKKTKDDERIQLLAYSVVSEPERNIKKWQKQIVARQSQYASAADTFRLPGTQQQFAAERMKMKAEMNIAESARSNRGECRVHWAVGTRAVSKPNIVSHRRCVIANLLASNSACFSSLFFRARKEGAARFS